MKKIEIKPLSVNRAWQGKRFKTKEYKAYETECMYRLPAFKVPETGDLKVEYEFGLSNALSDYDNAIKPFQDILQKKYQFDDRRISEAVIRKVKTEKGQEYIRFSISLL